MSAETVASGLKFIEDKWDYNYRLQDVMVKLFASKLLTGFTSPSLEPSD